MRRLTCLLIAGVFSLGLAADDNKDGKMTGCLTKSAAGEYVLTNEAGEKVTVTGASDLEKHSANHTVTLHGSQKKDGDKTTFHAVRVEHVASSCTAPPAK